MAKYRANGREICASTKHLSCRRVARVVRDETTSHVITIDDTRALAPFLQDGAMDFVRASSLLVRPHPVSLIPFQLSSDDLFSTRVQMDGAHRVGLRRLHARRMPTQIDIGLAQPPGFALAHPR